MVYKDFDSLFRQQVYAISFEQGLDLALAVCRQLYPNYEHFVLSEHWGNKDVLLDAIRLCEQAKTSEVEKVKLKEMLSKVDSITPHMDDFGNYNGSYALNAAASVYETLEFIIDKGLQHIYNIGTYLTDTMDFKIAEQQDLTDEQIDEHPMMVQARTFLLEQTKPK